ncbi:MAG TPA: CPBP family intramembrane glutamic endopeptidase, partial [Adhaeribacter sp.]|nr:CPBP family intramembrane glutamic endopeptidase [Adhaeribacter sp.]
MKGFISPGLHPFYKLLILLMFMAGGLFVAMFFAMTGLSVFFGFSIADIGQVTTNPGSFPNGRNAMIFYQIVTHLCMFTLAPLLFLAWSQPNVKRYLFCKENYPALLLLTAFLALLIMPANSWLIELNANMHLPDFLKGLEEMARQKEDQLAELTKFLTSFQTPADVLVGLLAFALIPAIGEELVFRGIMQRNLLDWCGNRHAAIWITAIIFGAIHVQFFGFFPRVLLGAVFGYLYLWSGNLWVPITAHFMNNGFAVVALYLQQQKLIETNLETTEASP